MTSAQRLSEIIIPEVYNNYIDIYTAELSRIRQAGIVGTVAGVEVPSGGVAVNMPFWGDLLGRSEVMEIGVALTPERIVAGRDVAAIHARAKSWNDADLTDQLTGSDPLGAIARKTGGFWARDEQAILLLSLQGVFAAPSMSGNLLETYSTGNAINRNMLIDAISLLGDAGSNLTGIVCHSAVMYDLAKKGLLDPRVNIGDPSFNASPELATYLGRQVIYDDTCPVEDISGQKVYTTYIFGNAAIGFAGGTPKVPVSTQRDEYKSEEALFNRRIFVLHPRGVKWKGAFTGKTPTDAELADGANWERVYENKLIRIACLRHLIG